VDPESLDTGDERYRAALIIGLFVGRLSFVTVRAGIHGLGILRSVVV
jgi:hypothetical protein